MVFPAESYLLLSTRFILVAMLTVQYVCYRGFILGGEIVSPVFCFVPPMLTLIRLGQVTHLSV